jgi:D-alanyl-D-alanine carboxypeptidase/D-alanyl-D-alanine-endopeptidase (penicillin-binding protein 4)
MDSLASKQRPVPFVTGESSTVIKRHTSSLRHVLLGVSLLVPVLTGHSLKAQSLETLVKDAIRKAQLGDTTVSISIRNANDSTELVEVRDSQAMLPASNMKLFTSGAALHVLGKDFSFRSSLVLDGEHLWFIGGGDPAFGDPKLLAETSWVDPDGTVHEEPGIDLLLDQLVKTVLGEDDLHIEELIVDDRIFDRTFVHPDWPKDQLDKHYCAEVAGVNFALNVLRIDAVPRKNAPPDISRMTPRIPWLLPENKATGRSGKGEKTAIGVSRKPGDNQFVVWGNVLEPVRAEVALSNMPALFARLLHGRLVKAGVEVDRFRVARTGDNRTDEARELLLIRTPIEHALKRCNTDSSNLYAESLLKMVGHVVELAPGSWENGSRAVRMAILERIGPEHVLTFRQADGSGLSRRNQVTAETVTAWLASFHNDPELGPTFVESLADPIEARSLRTRFRDLPASISLDAKTGHINGVSCLSGLVSSPDGRCYAFSVLCNDIPAKIGTRRAKDLQERIVDILADSLLAEQTVLGGD